MVIQSESNEGREKVIQAVKNEMDEKYEIMALNQPELKIKVFAMSFKFSEEGIIEKLRKQNEILKNGVLNIVKVYEYKRNGQVFYNAILNIDNDFYAKVMNEEKVNVG